jgi:hypothetical protein
MIGQCNQIIKHAKRDRDQHLPQSEDKRGRHDHCHGTEHRHGEGHDYLVGRAGEIGVSAFLQIDLLMRMLQNCQIISFK